MDTFHFWILWFTVACLTAALFLAVFEGVNNRLPWQLEELEDVG